MILTVPSSIMFFCQGFNTAVDQFVPLPSRIVVDLVAQSSSVFVIALVGSLFEILCSAVVRLPYYIKRYRCVFFLDANSFFYELCNIIVIPKTCVGTSDSISRILYEIKNLYSQFSKRISSIHDFCLFSISVKKFSFRKKVGKYSVLNLRKIYSAFESFLLNLKF